MVRWPSSFQRRSIMQEHACSKVRVESVKNSQPNLKLVEDACVGLRFCFMPKLAAFIASASSSDHVSPLPMHMHAVL